jgi:hypothetical protein
MSGFFPFIGDVSNFCNILPQKVPNFFFGLGSVQKLKNQTIFDVGISRLIALIVLLSLISTVAELAALQTEGSVHQPSTLVGTTADNTIVNTVEPLITDTLINEHLQ